MEIRDTINILRAMLQVSDQEARAILDSPLHRKFLDNSGVWVDAEGIYQVGRRYLLTLHRLEDYGPELPSQRWANYATKPHPALGRPIASQRPFWPLTPNVRPLVLDDDDVDKVLTYVRDKRGRQTDPAGKGKWMSRDIFKRSDGLLFGRRELTREKAGLKYPSALKHHRQAGHIRTIRVPDPWADEKLNRGSAKPGASKCLNPSCEHPAFNRGLCKAHYQAVRRDVMKGQTTWADLERRGVSLPPGRRFQPGRTCIQPKCKGGARKRGLCPMHYMRLVSEVKQGKSTWAKLEVEKRCLPAQLVTGGRRNDVLLLCLEDADKIGERRANAGRNDVPGSTAAIAKRLGLTKGKDRIALGGVLTCFREEHPDEVSSRPVKAGGNGMVREVYDYHIDRFLTWLNNRSVHDPCFRGRRGVRAAAHEKRARLFVLYVLSRGHFESREFNAFLESPPPSVEPCGPVSTQDVWDWATEAKVPMRCLRDTHFAAALKKELGIRMIQKGLARGEAQWELKAPVATAPVQPKPTVRAPAAPAATPMAPGKKRGRQKGQTDPNRSDRLKKIAVAYHDRAKDETGKDIAARLGVSRRTVNLAAQMFPELRK